MFHSGLRSATGMALLLWLAGISGAFASGNFGPTSNFVFDRKTGTEVSVYSPFEGVPSHGYLPVRVVIRNGFEVPRQWTLSFRSHCSDPYRSRTEYNSSFDFNIPPGAEEEHEIMVPLAPILDETFSNNVVSLVIDSRIGRKVGQISSYPLYEWPSVGMSEGVNGKSDNLTKLSTHVQSNYSTKSMHGSEPVAVLFEAPELTRDWRGYTGFDALLMTDKEWMALDPVVRRGVLEWNRLGGDLHLFSSDPDHSLQKLGIDAKGGKRGLGRVLIERWDGERINFSSIGNTLANDTRIRAEELALDYTRDDWTLQRTFGSRPFNPILVFLILVAFAIVVGPVNLFVLAKPGMRHRMFITTPVISMAASLLLVLIILFQDGFGGSGQRAALMLLNSESSERSAYLVQEQISRTGVLLGRSFEIDDPSYFSPVVMDSSRWTHFDTAQSGSSRFRIANHVAAGDWFRSRSEQAQFCQSIRPTRARIEQLESSEKGNPRLFSSMNLTLTDLYYVDPDGGIWRSKGSVTAGQEIELAKADQRSLNEYWETATELFGVSLGQRIRELALQRDVFLGVAKNQKDPMIPTLQSIRWRDDHLLVVGTPVDRETNPADE